MEEGHALRQEAYQREREALKALAEERERRHKTKLLALEAQMQAKLDALTRDLERANADQSGPSREVGISSLSCTRGL
jgi:septin family protein